MGDKKLTPRIGDRVLVKLRRHTTSYIGNVVELFDDDRYRVKVDGGPVGGLFADGLELTVVDRDPVEWPEGWERDGVEFAYNRIADIVVDKSGLKEFLATGPDMLARWDELVGGDE